MHVDDELAEVLVCLGIGLVTDYKEEIEAGHDGSTEVDVVLEGFGFVVSSEDRIGGS